MTEVSFSIHSAGSFVVPPQAPQTFVLHNVSVSTLLDRLLFLTSMSISSLRFTVSVSTLLDRLLFRTDMDTFIDRRGVSVSTLLDRLLFHIRHGSTARCVPSFSIHSAGSFVVPRVAAAAFAAA